MIIGIVLADILEVKEQDFQFEKLTTAQLIYQIVIFQNIKYCQWMILRYNKN